MLSDENYSNVINANRTVSSVYRLAAMGRGDAGVYSCEASNGIIEQPALGHFTVQVLCTIMIILSIGFIVVHVSD